jgi:hypothetical protein
VGKFDVEAAEPIPILSGRPHQVRRLTDKLAATKSNCTTTQSPLKLHEDAACGYLVQKAQNL